MLKSVSYAITSLKVLNFSFFGVPYSKRVREEPNRNFFGLRFLIPEHLNAVWELIRSLTMGYMYELDYREGWFSIMDGRAPSRCPLS